MHKKKKHIEKVNFCRNFVTNACFYGDENCWFVHEPEEAQEYDEFKCDSRKKEFNLLSDFLRHRKSNHVESSTRKLDIGLCLSRTKNCADYDSRGFEPATL